jgi:hypothetical protein
VNLKGTHVPQLGTIKASYVHRQHFGGMTVYRRMIGPYMVRTFVDYMGRATGTIWVKED